MKQIEKRKPILRPRMQPIDSSPGRKRSQLKIKVLIADDSPLMRRAIRELLSQEAGIEIVGEAYTLSDTLAMKEQYQPDIVVMDLHMMEERDVPPALLSAAAPRC
jgi:PleD family two-component response regulator